MPGKAARGRMGPPARSLRAAAALVGLQGALLVVGAIVLAISGLRPDAVQPGGAEILALIALLGGVGCLALARALARERRAVLSPTLVLELICLPVALTVLRAGRWYVAVPLALVAVAVLGLLAAAGWFAGDPD